MSRIKADIVGAALAYYCAGGWVFEIGPVSAEDLARVGWVEAPGASAALAALNAAQSQAMALRKGAAGVAALERQAAAQSSEALARVMEDPAAQDHIAQRLAAHFAAAVRRLGRARPEARVGACSPAEAEYLDPVELVTDETLDDVDREVPRLWVGRWPATLWLGVGGAAHGLQEETARILRTFRSRG